MLHNKNLDHPTEFFINFKAYLFIKEKLMLTNILSDKYTSSLLNLIYKKFIFTKEIRMHIAAKKIF